MAVYTVITVLPIIQMSNNNIKKISRHNSHPFTVKLTHLFAIVESFASDSNTPQLYLCNLIHF